MKKMQRVIVKMIYQIQVAFLLIMLLMACNDEFMDRFPETSLSVEGAFNTVKDLELYTNRYYLSLEKDYSDSGFRDYMDYIFDYTGDNYVSYGRPSEYNDLIRGNISPETVKGWSRTHWGYLRTYNFFLDNVYKAAGKQSDINHYIGITRLQRAIWYYGMVKRYNDVPWYSHAISDTDEELLYKARDPRTLVVDSIIADMDFAVKNIKEDIGNRTRYSKWYAATMLSRICLYEGTFRKYHDELNLQSTANNFLNKAIEAAEIVMKSGKFSIDKSGGITNAYISLFSSMDLSKSTEMILFRDYDSDSNIKTNMGWWSFNNTANGSRSLMESYQYLTPEGKAVPFSTVPGYDKMNYVEVFENRDPRMSQTLMCPGYIQPGYSLPNLPNMNLGGYPVIKYIPPTLEQYGSGSSFNQVTDVPLSRYAEVLLNYAEAKAELGILTQSDLDNSINLIRDRVGLPHTVLGDIIEDETLKAQFPNINNYILLEIRRERRIELAFENFRWDDLMRWKAGHLINHLQEGIYIKQFGVFDVTADGIPDIGIFEDAASNTIPVEERANYTFYYLKDDAGGLNTFALSNGKSGHIIINQEIGRRNFKQPQHYYWPIPLQQITLNPALKQTIFWE